MPHESRPYPDFSWSHSRDGVLLECARAYYWRFYGSHNGWVRGAPAQVRLAYVLKNLTTLPQVLGTALHACARTCVLVVRRGERRPGFDALLAVVSNELNRAVLGSHRRGAFLRDPKRNPMLRDAWYTGRTDSAAVVEAALKARRCVRSLCESSVWAELEACRPEWIAAADTPEAFIHEGWPVFAGPDLVYRVAGRQVIILDWKTGDDSEADLQIPTYALYCRKVLGLPFRDGEWFGRVVNLSTGADETREITRLDLLRAAERIRASVGAMHSLLTDPEGNVPGPREAFPLAPEGRRQACRFCAFFGLCEEELADAPTLLP
ncbi:MAG TPA: PD-(D/E)XK nuclease family protein [Longimicrobium sp.]|jgi:hypothetical protein